MFTGIIEELAEIVSLKNEHDNLHITLKSSITPQLKIDQSISHNGVCLTVVAINNSNYTVTAIQETINKTNFNTLKLGDRINIERAMKLGDRLDGHIVQGHIDQTGKCVDKKETNGSWLFTFEYDSYANNITIEKGSITINGVSLTIINSTNNNFSVAIIPYTFKHTNFLTLKIGDTINLEFDVIGKYVARLMS